jgi:hypothetical protein
MTRFGWLLPALVYLPVVLIIAAAQPQPPASDAGDGKLVDTSTALTPTDCGSTYATLTNGVVFTLPGSPRLAHGCSFLFVNGAANGAGAISIVPGAGGHRIAGSTVGGVVAAVQVPFFTLAGIVNTGATHQRGDSVRVTWYVASSPTQTLAAWVIEGSSGVWLEVE